MTTDAHSPQIELEVNYALFWALHTYRPNIPVIAERHISHSKCRNANHA